MNDKRFPRIWDRDEKGLINQDMYDYSDFIKFRDQKCRDVIYSDIGKEINGFANNYTMVDIGEIYLDHKNNLIIPLKENIYHKKCNNHRCYETNFYNISLEHNKTDPLNQIPPSIINNYMFVYEYGRFVAVYEYGRFVAVYEDADIITLRNNYGADKKEIFAKGRFSLMHSLAPHELIKKLFPAEDVTINGWQKTVSILEYPELFKLIS